MARRAPKTPKGQARKDTHDRGPAKIVAAIAKRVERGTHINHACALERVARSAVYRWIEEDESLMAVLEYARAVAAENQRETLEALIAEGSKTAGVQLHYMERSHPREFAPAKQTVEHLGSGGGAPIVVYAHETDEERARRRSEARAALAAPREEESDETDADR